MQFCFVCSWRNGRAIVFRGQQRWAFSQRAAFRWRYDKGALRHRPDLTLPARRENLWEPPMISWASREALIYSSFLMWRLATIESTVDSRRKTLLLSEREERSPFEMSDIIWHYCYLMGGVSASSARGIRTSAAGAVCLNLNSQALLLQRSPPTLPDNPPTLVWEGRQQSEIPLLSSSGRRMRPELLLLLLPFRVGWGQELGGGGRELSSISSRKGVSADKEPDVWQTDWLTRFQASQGSSCLVPTWLHE